MPNSPLELAFRDSPSPNFKIFSGALKAFTRDDGRKYLSCTASSSVNDLHGDTMTAECVQDMAPQAKRKSMNIFLNHSYEVPEDVFGKTVDAAIVTRAADDAGPIYDLDLEVVLNEANPRAIATYEAIKDQGIKLGVSIGAMITDYDFKDADKSFWGGLTIKEVELLEASIVGIPANPRSWVQNAVRAVKSFEESKPVQLESIDMKTALKDAMVELGATVEDITDKATCPDCGKSDCSHMAGGEDVVDTAADAGEAVETDTTEPEVQISAEAEAEEPTSPVDLEASSKAAGVDVELIKKLIDELTAEKTARAAAEATVKELSEIVEKIARLPLGRKTSFQPHLAAFEQKVSSIYGEGLVKLFADERNPNE